MDGTFVNSLVENTKRPVRFDIGGQALIMAPEKDGGYGVFMPDEQPVPEPSPIAIETLSGLVHYLVENLDGLDLAKLCVHVVAHNRVRLISAVQGLFQQRFTHVCADACPPVFSFGEFHDCERFVIALQSVFLPTTDREKVLRVVGTIREETVRTTGDDGVAQQVRASAGIVKVADVPVPSPVRLAPFRTFSEVEQPESAFVLRLQSGPEGGKPRCALFEADGGAWRLTAIERVVAFLAQRLGETPSTKDIKIIA